jgi:2-polyprenyl-6-methoxyphenol hydroxylase-like FAD-dependent oxidoreductase
MGFTDQLLAQPRERHAIVMGGSIAGLLAARVLSEHFTRVTIIERDRLSKVAEPRKGTPQGRHVHSLLARGLGIIERRFPGISDNLARAGAPVLDAARDARWHHFGGYKTRFTSGLTRPSMTRALLEHEVRRRVLALPNVRTREGCVVEGFVPTEDRSRVIGVWFRANGGSVVESLGADLIVDATGRGSRTPDWLEALGYEKPAESEVRVDVRYASRFYHRRPGDALDARVLYVFPTPPLGRRFGLAVPVEGDRWLVTLGGWHGEAPPLTGREFEEFASTLEAQDVAALLRRAEPLSDIVSHRFISNVRRHYEKLKRLPRGLVVTGDALCSFNPIYAQGMSVSAIEAEALASALAERTGDGAWDDLARRFYRRAARVIDVPWRLATGGDFQYPETEGERRLTTNLFNWYMARVHRAATRDELAYRTFLRVAALIDRPSALFHPRMFARVITKGGTPAPAWKPMRIPTPIAAAARSHA